MIHGRERNKLAYLDAIGVPFYVSRRDLPGAAPSVRVRLAPVAPAPLKESASPGSRVVARGAADLPRDVQPAAVPGTEVPAAEPGMIDRAGVRERFSVAAVVAGRWLWLEELAQGVLASEQLQLIQAMAFALGAAPESPRQAQFNWPMHNNAQLDQGEDAARASLTSFVSRQLQQQSCAGLILLGQQCGQRLVLGELGSTVCMKTHSTADMLVQPMLKKQAWIDLKSLIIIE